MFHLLPLNYTLISIMPIFQEEDLFKATNTVKIVEKDNIQNSKKCQIREQKTKIHTLFFYE